MGLLDRVFGGKSKKEPKPSRDAGSGRFGRYLVESDRLTEEQLAQATQASVSRGGRLGTVIYELGLIDLVGLCAALADFHQTSAVTPAQFLSLKSADAQALDSALSVKLQAVSLGTASGRVQVAMVNPKDADQINEVVMVLRAAVQPLAAPEMLIQYALREHHGFKVSARMETIIEGMQSEPVDEPKPHDSIKSQDVAGVLDRYGLLDPPTPGLDPPMQAADASAVTDTEEPETDLSAATSRSSDDEFGLPEDMVPETSAAPLPAVVATEKVDGASKDVLLKLAKAALLARQMNYGDSAAAYREILDIDPDNGRARHALEELERKLGNAPELDRVSEGLDNAVGAGGGAALDARVRQEVVMDNPEVVEALQAAASREELANVLLEAACVGLEAAALFARDSDDLFVGLVGRGGTLDNKDLSAVMVPSFVPTVLSAGASCQEGFRGQPDDGTANEILLAELGRDMPAECVVFPVLQGEEKAQIVLYGDCGAQPVDEEFAEKLRGLCLYAGDVIRRFIEEAPSAG